jgi:hypothetical protein
VLRQTLVGKPVYPDPPLGAERGYTKILFDIARTRLRLAISPSDWIASFLAWPLHLKLTVSVRAELKKVAQFSLVEHKNRMARLMRQQQLVTRKKRAFRPKTSVAASRAEPNRIVNLVAERTDQIRVSDFTSKSSRKRFIGLQIGSVISWIPK